MYRVCIFCIELAGDIQDVDRFIELAGTIQSVHSL
jgi:hypothetical protein